MKRKTRRESLSFSEPGALGLRLTSLSEALSEALHQPDEAPQQDAFDQQRNQRSGDGGRLQGVRLVVEPLLYHLGEKPTASFCVAMLQLYVCFLRFWWFQRENSSWMWEYTSEGGVSGSIPDFGTFFFVRLLPLKFSKPFIIKVFKEDLRGRFTITA